MSHHARRGRALEDGSFVLRPMKADGDKHMVRRPICLENVAESAHDAGARAPVERSQRTDPQNLPPYLVLASRTFSASTQGARGAPPSAVPLRKN